jgi:TolA protein
MAQEAQARRQAAELEARSRALEAEARQRAEEAERRQAAELAARQQAEETARQQALMLERQRQAQQLAEQQAAAAQRQAQLRAEQQAVELAARQAADAAARRQGERDAPGSQGGSAGAQSVVQKPGDGAPATTGSSSNPAAKPTAQLLARLEPRPGLQVPLPLPANPRRRTLIGLTDRDVGAMMYAQGWRQKIELNATLDLLKGLAPGSYQNPVVTVALRSDGSVENVVINRSSGLAQVDDAVRRIVQALAPYPPFPPGLAQDYDVIEIRRVWTFDAAVRLFSGGR